MAKFVPLNSTKSEETPSQPRSGSGSAKFVPFSEDQQLAQSFGQSEFGPSDVSFSTRMRVDSGDNFAEKQNIFKRIFPEGDFQRAPGSGDLVFRRDPSESYRLFNPKGADVTDVASITGQAAAPMLGEIAANVPFLAGGPAGGLAVAGRSVLGAVVGEITKQFSQYSTGVQEQEPGEAFGSQPAFEGVMSLVGSGIGTVATKAFDGIRGAGALSLKPGAREAIKTADRLGVATPLPGQTTRSKIIERLQGQSGQTTPVIQQSIDRTNASLTQALSDLGSLSPAERNSAISSINAALDSSRTQMINTISSGRAATREEFGQLIQNTRTQFAKDSQAGVNEAYNFARSFEEPSFELSSLQETASNIAKQTRVTTRGEGGEAAEEVIPDGLDELRTIARQIERADPESVRIEQLNAWERQLFDLSQPSVPGGPVREINSKARQLRSSVKNTFDTPVSDNKQFARAWKKAREAAAKRFDTLEDSFSLEIAKTDRPSLIVDRLMSPQKLTNEDVNIIRRISSDEKFRNIQGAFVDRLLLDPDRITQTLKAYDQEALQRMVSPKQLEELQELGTKVDNLNNLNIQKAVKRQDQFLPFIRDLVASDRQTARISNLREFVEQNGGLEGNLGRVIRGGLVEELAKKVSQNIQQGEGRQIGARALNKALEDFEERGLTQFFTRTELSNLRDILQLSEFTDVGGEGVAGLIGAQTTQQAFQGKFQALVNLVRNFGLGNLLVSKGGKRFIQGVGKAPTRRELSLPAINAVGRVLVEDAKLGADEGFPSIEEVEQFVSNQTAEEE